MTTECPYCASLYPGHRCHSCGAPKRREARERELVFDASTGMYIGGAHYENARGRDIDYEMSQMAEEVRQANGTLQGLSGLVFTLCETGQDRWPVQLGGQTYVRAAG